MKYYIPEISMVVIVIVVSVGLLKVIIGAESISWWSIISPVVVLIVFWIVIAIKMFGKDS